MWGASQGVTLKIAIRILPSMYKFSPTENHLIIIKDSRPNLLKFAIIAPLSSRELPIRSIVDKIRIHDDGGGKYADR